MLSIYHAIDLSGPELGSGHDPVCSTDLAECRRVWTIGSQCLLTYTEIQKRLVARQGAWEAVASQHHYEADF